MKKSLLVLALVVLSGCSTTGQFTNRLASTKDCSETYIVSYWTKYLKFAFDLDKRDASCK